MARLKRVWSFARNNRNVLFFVGGFLFDVLTTGRIDSWTEIGLQLAYISALTGLLIGQYYEQRGFWKPTPGWLRLWRYNSEALHFLYGGLLSIYVVLYSRSAAGAKPLIFFLLLVSLMVLNEMPQIRRYGHRLRLGLYAFCMVSFLIYFVPVLIGRIGAWVFALSVTLAGTLVWWIAALLTKQDSEPRAARRRLFLPAGGVLGGIVVLYFMRLIPPVPLALQFDGVYHRVEKLNGDYALYYPRPPFYLFWKTDSRPFAARPGDQMCYFARVFAPRRFRHELMVVWQRFDEPSRRFITTDRFSTKIMGGRESGFRLFAMKSEFQPGLWRVLTETGDGRLIGRLAFKVVQDARTKQRRWKEVRM